MAELRSFVYHDSQIVSEYDRREGSLLLLKTVHVRDTAHGNKGDGGNRPAAKTDLILLYHLSLNSATSTCTWSLQLT